MPTKFFTEEAQFYITNVCNLTCDDCITFNNRNFKGHFDWKSIESEYKQWSTRLNINSIAILGGEPFTNPFLLEWVHGLKECWPNAKDYSICTNGTFLDKDIINEVWDAGYWLEICVHDPAMYEAIESKIQTLIELKFQNVRIEEFKYGHDIGKYYYYNNQKIVKLSKQYVFTVNTVKFVKNNVTYMNESNMVRAHESCQFRYGCYYFVHGELYKCYLTAIAKEFVKQFPLDEKSKEILLDYKSGTAWATDEYLEEFFRTLKDPIKQCSLCFENPAIKPTWPLAKKKTIY
jgi:organic radical activating enzyme